MKIYIQTLSLLLLWLTICSSCTTISKGQEREVSEDISTHIKANYRVNACNVSLQDSTFLINLDLLEDDAICYRRVTILEQSILIDIYDLIPQNYTVVFYTKPIAQNIQDTLILNAFHRRMPYSYADISAEKIDSEFNPLFHKSIQYILKEIKPGYIIAIDQIYQNIVLENYKEYNPYGPTFIFLVQARTIECRDTPRIHKRLDELKRLQRILRAFDVKEYYEIADLLDFFIEMCSVAV